jgi:ElaB/YqjD/DUF883 family membrane-anchored ribosome-binding protein
VTGNEDTSAQRQAMPETPSDPDELREEIAATREDLGETVQALADKANVKARAREMVKERKQQAGHAAEHGVQAVRRRPLPFAVVAALLVGLFIGAFLQRRR